MDNYWPKLGKRKGSILAGVPSTLKGIFMDHLDGVFFEREGGRGERAPRVETTEWRKLERVWSGWPLEKSVRVRMFESQGFVFVLRFFGQILVSKLKSVRAHVRSSRDQRTSNTFGANDQIMSFTLGECRRLWLCLVTMHPPLSLLMFWTSRTLFLGNLKKNLVERI